MNATELVRLLDEAGIRGAVVLSLGYQFGNPNKPPVADEYSAVKAENDWTAAQIAPFGDRLVGFCGLNPLKPYALEEISRCASRIRQIGVTRVLYGSDGALPPAYTPKKAWEAFRRLPLTDAEFKIIANNRATYMEGNR